MKIVVMSDSHGITERVQMIMDREKDADLYIHCGDVCDADFHYPEILAVRGNNDYFTDYPFQRIIERDGLRILVTHSTQFNYSNRYERLEMLGRDNNCQLVCFGHTHVFHTSNRNGVILLNPGSCWLNRNGDRPCYAVVEYDGEELNIIQKYTTK